MITKTTITIEIDTMNLQSYTDEYIAQLWHIAQANPAPFADKTAGDLAATIGFEIIRRWLRKAPAELYKHQAQHSYWNELRKLGHWEEGVFVPDFISDEEEVLP